ncbi:hypothetical protein J6TS2_33740 [Heyndrickxia sporothermodurans]|nr:hypothetical protein J6TS2_33740 [Heyndrickxia sporothermodurans]
MINGGSLIIIGAVALVLFGPKKLPEIGKAAGKTLREFKNATSGLIDDDTKENNQKPIQTSKDDHINQASLQTETNSNTNTSKNIETQSGNKETTNNTV